jgi:uncharacterized protein (DUF2267 family)
MALRETIIAEIEEMGTAMTIPQTKALADAILAAIRERVTSPEAVERVRAALHRVRYSRAASIVNGTFKVSDTNMSEDAEAAILAALGEDHDA